MGVKRKHKKRKVVDCCDVPDCGREVYLGWDCQGIRKKICKYHFKRHCNENDEFSLFDVFNIKVMQLAPQSVQFSEFGRPLPHDYDEMQELAEKHRIIEGGAKKEESIERLNKWKAKNGDHKRKKKRRSKPPPSRPDKRERQTELDDIVGDILGD